MMPDNLSQTAAGTTNFKYLRKIFFWLKKNIYFCTPFKGKSVRWCNGSTRDFGSLGLGSSPGRTTLKNNHPAADYRASQW